MLGKLLKYDFKAGAQIITTIIISMALLLCFSLALIPIHNNILNSIIIVVSVFASIGLFASFVIVRILHFYNTMTKNESYFTYSIPVSINKIVFSKVFTSFIWGIISILTIVFFWVILLNFMNNGSYIAGFPNSIALFTIVIGLSQFIFMMMLMAFSISLSVYPRFKNKNTGIVISVISYIVLYYGLGIVQLIFLAISQLIQGNLQNILNNNLSEDRLIDVMNTSILPAVIIYLLFGAIFYYLTVKIFSKHKSI